MPIDEENEAENETSTNTTNPNDNGNQAATTTAPPSTNEEWTRVIRSGRATKTPTLFNPETGNVLTTSEDNYYKILEDLNEFEPMEVATLAGSDINSKLKSVAAEEDYDKHGITHACKRVKLKWKKNKARDDNKSLED